MAVQLMEILPAFSTKFLKHAHYHPATTTPPNRKRTTVVLPHCSPLYCQVMALLSNGYFARDTPGLVQLHPVTAGHYQTIHSYCSKPPVYRWCVLPVPLTVVLPGHGGTADGDAPSFLQLHPVTCGTPAAGPCLDLPSLMDSTPVQQQLLRHRCFTCYNTRVREV